MKILITKYKPKYSENFEIKLEDINSSTFKKTLLKMITYYHPDKQPLSDMKNKIFSEEITKELSRHYDTFKSTS